MDGYPAVLPRAQGRRASRPRAHVPVLRRRWVHRRVHRRRRRPPQAHLGDGVEASGQTRVGPAGFGTRAGRSRTEGGAAERGGAAAMRRSLAPVRVAPGVRRADRGAARGGGERYRIGQRVGQCVCRTTKKEGRAREPRGFTHAVPRGAGHGAGASHEGRPASWVGSRVEFRAGARGDARDARVEHGVRVAAVLGRRGVGGRVRGRRSPLVGRPRRARGGTRGGTRGGGGGTRRGSRR
mmetsp:Transcript_10864/g.43795  ORF Transcript_10864/g.43795 Transcript_10864/m.43795 type:complete len:238 (+) Transcript_10864:323-1036(+)